MRQTAWDLVLVLCVACGVLAGCGQAVQPVLSAATPVPTSLSRQLVVGEVPDDPVTKVVRLQPMADYLASRLGDHGFVAGQVRTARTVTEMARLLRAGEVDIVMDSPYSALLLVEAGAAEPVLRRWKQGQARYSAVLFARADRGIRGLRDLLGRPLALKNETSTSDYLLPLAALGAHGLIATAGADPPTREVTYVLPHSDANVIQWVLSGKVDAGATDSGLFAELPPATRARLVVLHESVQVLRQYVLLRPGIDRDLVAAITRELVQMDQTAPGTRSSGGFEETARFDAIPGAEGIDLIRTLAADAGAVL